MTARRTIVVESKHGKREYLRGFDNEFGVISCVVLRPEVLPLVELSAEDFAEPRCRIIWEAATTLYAEHGVKGVDAIAIADALGGAHGLEAHVIADLATDWALGSPELWRHAATGVKRRAIDRKLRAAAQEIARSKESGLELYELARKEILTLEVGAGMSAVPVGDVTAPLLEEVEKARLGKTIDYFRWGQPELDRFWSLPRGGVFVVGGRPGEGKTLLMGWLALRLAERGERILRVTTELEHMEDHRRAVSQRSRVDQNRWLLKYRLTQEEHERYVGDLRRYQNKPIWYLARTGNLKTICREIDFCRRVHRVTVVMVDHVNELYDPSTMRRGRREELNAIWSGLRNSCREGRESGIATLVAAAELVRPPKDKRGRTPTMDDFKGSGKAEEIADVCVLLHDPHKHDHHEPENEILAIVDKHRHGPKGLLRLRYDREKGHILGIAADRPGGSAPPTPVAPARRAPAQTAHWTDNYDD